MFSASLVSVLFHLVRPYPDADERVSHPTVRNAANVLRNAAARLISPYPLVPIVARSYKPNRLIVYFEKANPQESGIEDGGAIIWGRFPLNTLISYLSEYCETSPEEEYIDVAASWFAEASQGNSFATRCATLLQVQRPTSLNRLDIPSCQADCLPSKSGGSWGFETGTLFCR